VQRAKPFAGCEGVPRFLFLFYGPQAHELSYKWISVVSDTLTGNTHDIHTIRRADVHQKIAELKRQPGKDILITGSRTLWNDLLEHDLVDEIHLLVGNLILGEEVPVFMGKPDASLRLIDVRPWEDSNHILARYEVLHKSVETQESMETDRKDT